MTSTTPFSPSEQTRYGRQMLLPQVGPEGQRRLRDARVLIVGAGGLGAPVSLYLAAAGVGHITLLDGDVVELSNLQRQIIFDTASVGQPKAEAAARRLRALNPEIAVVAAPETLTAGNAEAWIAAADLVLDCCDNFPTRYLINDFCRHLGKPWLFAAVHRFRGHLALFSADTACFRCLYPRT
ncbi:MAG: HesA/MoeB/ThiF family protein, partial [Bacteroidales bacterium]|nr:HesA/MoeB/ThiF family protein [Bacteroidales bacterium]